MNDIFDFFDRFYFLTHLKQKTFLDEYDILNMKVRDKNKIRDIDQDLFDCLDYQHCLEFIDIINFKRKSIVYDFLSNKNRLSRVKAYKEIRTYIEDNYSETEKEVLIHILAYVFLHYFDTYNRKNLIKYEDCFEVYYCEEEKRPKKRKIKLKKNN